MHVRIIFGIYADNKQIHGFTDIWIYIHTSCLDIPFYKISSSPWLVCGGRG